MEYKSEEQRLQFVHGIQDLDIKIIGKNLIEINGDILRVKHNYGAHYGLKSIETMNKKEREAVLAYGDEDISSYKWMKDRDLLEDSNPEKKETLDKIKNFITKSSTNPLDTYDLVKEIDDKFNTDYISTIENEPYHGTLGKVKIFDGTVEKYSDDEIKMIGDGKIAFSIQELEPLLINIYYK